MEATKSIPTTTTTPAESPPTIPVTTPPKIPVTTIPVTTIPVTPSPTIPVTTPPQPQVQSLNQRTSSPLSYSNDLPHPREVIDIDGFFYTFVEDADDEYSGRSNRQLLIAIAKNQNKFINQMESIENRLTEIEGHMNLKKKRYSDKRCLLL